MTLTHKIYNDLSVSLSAGKHQTLSKVYTTPSGISLIYAMNRDTEKRALYFVVEEKSVEAQKAGFLENESLIQENPSAENEIPEAETEKVKAEAKANANEILTQSIDDKILQQQFIEKWDGKLPVVNGNEGNILDVSSLIGNQQ